MSGWRTVPLKDTVVCPPEAARSRTAEQTQRVLEETKQLVGGFGDVHSKEHARKCVTQALLDYIAGRNEGMRDTTISVALGELRPVNSNRNSKI